MEMPNLSDGDVISACISKDAFMKAPDESSIKKDFPEKATEWIATDGKWCTDAEDRFHPTNCVGSAPPPCRSCASFRIV